MGLDNQGSQPLYKQLEEKIIQDIENGIYRKGQKIPTEKELSQMYDVSRITVRKALEEITKQGILERHAGKGTYVASVKLQRSIATFMSFTEFCEAQGLKPGARMIKNVIEPRKIVIRWRLNRNPRYWRLTESVMQMGYQFLWSRDDLQKIIFIFCRKI